MTRTLLALNAGSSSLKFSLFEQGDPQPRLLRGRVTGIPGGSARFRATDEGGRTLIDEDIAAQTHAEAVRRVLALMGRNAESQTAAVGHRVVHGGAGYTDAVLIDDDVLADLRALTPFAPLHQPAALAVIDAVSERFPDAPQVACFDTAIHRRLPEHVQRLPLPRRLWDEQIRRYGFHGLSYESLLDAQPDLADGRTVIAHLGHGCSLTAFRDGVPIDTTMGFTPTGGIPMSTRSGDLDPGVVIHLLEHHEYDAARLDRLVNREAGLLGVSGRSADMQELLDAAETDADAALAVEMFCYAVRKRIGALAAALGGLDHLVFSGGIGERAAAVRERVCTGLQHLHVELDAAANQADRRTISPSGSRCIVRVIPTDEEAMIARHTARIVNAENR